jgi:hypothetical protein
MDAKVNEMAKQFRAYEKAFAEAQNSFGKYEKAEKNEHLSRFEVSKTKQNMHAKCQLAEQAKQTCACFSYMFLFKKIEKIISD